MREPYVECPWCEGDPGRQPNCRQCEDGTVPAWVRKDAIEAGEVR